MKKISSQGVILAAGIWLGSILKLSATTLVVGSGSDSSFVGIQSPNLGVRTYEVRYDHNPSNPLNGFDLFSIADAEDPLISISYSNFPNSEASPNFFFDTVNFDGTTESGGVGIFWAHWVAGGEAGFPGSSVAPVADDAWSFGSGISSPYRAVEPGSWDVMFLSDGSSAPSIPVPEPSGVLILCGNALVLLLHRFRSV